MSSKNHQVDLKTIELDLTGYFGEFLSESKVLLKMWVVEQKRS